jgi:hypothetical protein
MSTPSAFTAIKNRLNGAWNTTPVVYENKFHEPTGAAFVYVEVFDDSLAQETIGAPGNNLWVESGTVYLHVMVPSGGGSETARSHAFSLKQLFREQDIGGLKITEMSIGSGEPGRDFPNYWALTLTLYYRRDDITSLP